MAGKPLPLPLSHSLPVPPLLLLFSSSFSSFPLPSPPSSPLPFFPRLLLTPQVAASQVVVLVLLMAQGQVSEEGGPWLHQKVVWDSGYSITETAGRNQPATFAVRGETN